MTIIILILQLLIIIIIIIIIKIIIINTKNITVNVIKYLLRCRKNGRYLN